MSEIKRIMLVDNGPGSRYFGEPPAIEAVEDVLKFVEKELEEQTELRKIYLKNYRGIETTVADINGRLYILRDLKARLKTHIKEIEQAEILHDMAEEGSR
tara:strand:+ start:70 stop:369 length:300 start_codon:yes stop_codon:yes gene_type:complete